MAERLASLHEIGVTHGDLKPDNLLIDKKEKLRIIDFGASFEGSSDRKVGTKLYAAWEYSV